MPCLDEAESVGGCIHQALVSLDELGEPGEIIVVDNGSTDGSAQVARSAGARVVFEPRRGYGNAYRTGIAASRGRYLVLGDADGTYDFSSLAALVAPLREGADLVIGSRMLGVMEAGAMPWLHRRLGNPLLTHLVNWSCRAGISDVYCGLRSMTRSAYDQLEVNSPGMEFALEVVVSAAGQGLRIHEIPVSYRRRQGGVSKLDTWRDGWRSLRFLLQHTL
jgi:glycosyltransferase involved in cell wall biosynthesis